MFAMVPIGVLAITQFPTSIEMALQLAVDPEVAVVREEPRGSTLPPEVKLAQVPEEPRRSEILESAYGLSGSPRERSR